MVLKRSFQMALMSVMNLVYNKLARQNIFCFINLISILVVLTYCFHYSYSCSSFYYYYYYSCSSYYYYHYYFYCFYHYYYYFIVITLVLSMLFILFYFISFFIVHITMIFVCDFVWRVRVPSFLVFFCFFFLMIHSIYSHCSYVSSMFYMSSSLSFFFQH